MADYARPRFNVTLLTPAFEITGQMEPIGPWLDWLTSRHKQVVPVYQARLMPLGTSQAAGAERPELYVTCNDICLIFLPDPAAHTSVNMLKNTRSAISHIGPVVCRGDWHMGMDTSLATFLDNLPVNFFPITQADLHYKVQLPVPLPARADLIIANRLHLTVYHPT